MKRSSLWYLPGDSLVSLLARHRAHPLNLVFYGPAKWFLMAGNKNKRSHIQGARHLFPHSGPNPLISEHLSCIMNRHSLVCLWYLPGDSLVSLLARHRAHPLNLVFYGPAKWFLMAGNKRLK